MEGGENFIKNRFIVQSNLIIQLNNKEIQFAVLAVNGGWSTESN